MTKGRKVKHHGLEIEIDCAWWAEAGMENFAPLTRAYVADPTKADGRRIFEIPIEDVRAVSRNPGVGIFTDNVKDSARERVVRILRWFVSGKEIEPVKVVCEPPGSPYRYKLVDGAHRFYCSVAAGFSHVPAVTGFDITTLDQ